MAFHDQKLPFHIVRVRDAALPQNFSRGRMPFRIMQSVTQAIEFKGKHF
jgi:hypothetical protein